MKKKAPQNRRDARILGRRLARELTREELARAGSGGVRTYTLTYPPDTDNIHP